MDYEDILNYIENNRGISGRELEDFDFN